MTAVLVLLALAALGLGGWGASIVRAAPRPAGVPFARSLTAGRRAQGAAIAGAGLVLLLLILVLRP